MLMTAPPPSCNWLSSAPAAQSKASASSMKTSYAFGSAMTGASTMACLTLKRASCPVVLCHFALGPVDSFCHEAKPTAVPYSFECRLSLAPTACQPLSETAWTTGGIPSICVRSVSVAHLPLVPWAPHANQIQFHLSQCAVLCCNQYFSWPRVRILH